MIYLRNTWYAAAWSSEIGENLLPRKILGESLVFYRGENGVVVSVIDMCPHRFTPLHLGRLVDGAIECPYHGLRFDNVGRCVFNPDGDGKIPSGARLKTFPIAERWGCVWIWMGDAAKADPSLIPQFEFLDDPEHFRPVTGLLNIRANYLLICDNLMDHAHVTLVHSDTLASDIISKAKSKLVRRPDGSIWNTRMGENGAPPQNLAMFWRLLRGEYQGTMDHWLDVRWNAPALLTNDVGITLHGAAREEGIEIKNSHFLTPETETTTHYFWSTVRGFALDNAQIDEQIRIGTEYLFTQEDEVILMALQEAMGDREFWSMKPALLPLDVGVVEVRRALSRLIAAEQAQMSEN